MYFGKSAILPHRILSKPHFSRIGMGGRQEEWNGRSLRRSRHDCIAAPWHLEAQHCNKFNLPTKIAS
jgi:hypothetical protein